MNEGSHNASLAATTLTVAALTAASLVLARQMILAYRYTSSDDDDDPYSSTSQPTKKTKKTKKPWKMVPGRIPIVGHSYKITSFSVLEARVTEWIDQYGDPNLGCIEIDLFGDRCVLLFTEERTKEVLKHRPRSIQRPLVVKNSVNSIGAKGLFSAEVEDGWTQERKLVSATLSHKNLQDYLTVFQAVVKRLMVKWETSSKDGSPMTIDSDLVRSMADAISQVAIGRDFDFLNQPDSQISKDIRAAMRAFEFRTLFARAPYWNIPWFGQYLDGYGGSIFRVERLIHSAIANEEQSSSDDHNSCSSSTTTTTTKQTFLQKLFAVMRSERSSLPRERVHGNILTLFLAGTDTSSKTIMAAFYLLAKDVELQQELYQTVQDQNLDDIDLSTLLHGLPLFKSFLHEVHRWYGTFLMGMKSVDDIPFCNTIAPKGTQFLMMQRYMSISPKVEAPGIPAGPKNRPHYEFCAHRWLVPHDGADGSSWVCQSPGITNLSFMPFGYGVRSCPGRSYSEALSLLLLARALQKFKLSLPPNHPPVTFVSGTTMVPDCEIRLTFQPRTG